MSKVLVVDDEESIRFSFEKILTDAGHTVVVASNLTYAKAILGADQFNVAVIDRILGAQNGMDIVKHIHETQPLCSTILISGFPSFKSASQGFKYNVAAYLTKPVKKAQLCQAVEDAAEKFRKRETARNLEMQLIRDQRMETLGLLAGGIVHNFNNLLTLISGYTELTIMEMDPDNPLLTNVEKISRETEQGRVISTHILSYIHPNEEKQTPVEIDGLVNDTIELIRLTLPKKIELIKPAPGVNDLILAYPAQIQQVIMNLSNNAQHAMKETGGVLEILFDRVTVADQVESALTLKPGSYIKITMSDTGCGMDELGVNKIFETKFTTIPHGTGKGFALGVSLKIAQNHGGTITVESEPGRGSKFHFYLPLLET